MSITDLVQSANDVVQWYNSLSTGEKVIWGAGALGTLCALYSLKVAFWPTERREQPFTVNGMAYPQIEGKYVEIAGTRYPNDYLNLDAAKVISPSERIDLLHAHWVTRTFPKGVSDDFTLLHEMYSNKKYPERIQRMADTILSHMKREMDHRWNSYVLQARLKDIGGS